MRKGVVQLVCMYVCTGSILTRANGSDACGFSNDQIDDNASRKHGIRTVSRSCEYACGFSNNQNDENTSRTHHIRTISPSCEHACAFEKH